MRMWRMGKSRLVLLGIAVALAIGFIVPVSAYAAANSTFKLGITSTECVVDVVQDGGGQSVQPHDSCAPIVPSLLTNIQKDPDDLSQLELPFAGEPQPSPVIFRIPEDTLAEQHWLPFTSTEQAVATTQPGVRTMTAVASGVTVLAVAGFLAIDVVVFEFQHTVRLGRLARTLVSRL